MRIWTLALSLLVGLVTAAPAPANSFQDLGLLSASAVDCQGACRQLALFVVKQTTQRITDVQVNDVDGVTGTYNAPNPFTAPLLSQPDVAQSLAFADLLVPSAPAGQSTSFTDLPDVIMSGMSQTSLSSRVLS